MKSTTTTKEFQNLHGDKCLRALGRSEMACTNVSTSERWEDSQNNLTIKNIKYGMDGSCEKHTEIPA